MQKTFNFIILFCSQLIFNVFTAEYITDPDEPNIVKFHDLEYEEEQEKELLNTVFATSKKHKNIFTQLKERQYGSNKNIIYHKNCLLYKIKSTKTEEIRFDRVYFSNDGKYLAVSYFNNETNTLCFKIYDSITGKCLNRFDLTDELDRILAHQIFIKMEFSNCNRYVLATCKYKTTLYDRLTNIALNFPLADLCGFIDYDNIFFINSNKLQIYNIETEQTKQLDCEIKDIVPFAHHVIHDNRLIIYTKNKDGHFLTKINLQNSETEKIKFSNSTNEYWDWWVKKYPLLYVSSDCGYLILLDDISEVKLQVFIIDVNEWKIVKKFSPHIYERGLVNLVKFPNIISISHGCCTFFYDLKKKQNFGYDSNLSNFIIKSTECDSNIISAFIDCHYPNGDITIYVWLFNNFEIGMNSRLNLDSNTYWDHRKQINIKDGEII